MDEWWLIPVVFACFAVAGAAPRIADELFAICGWAATRWARRRGDKRSSRFERYLESRKSRKALPSPATFESLWRPEDRPATWRQSPDQEAARLQAAHVASAVAVCLAQMRDLAYARMERLRGTPITKAHEAWRLLLTEIVDAESAFESLLTSPGQGAYAAERLKMLPPRAWSMRFPLEDHLTRLIIERRYHSFLHALGRCQERCLYAEMPDATGTDSTVISDMRADWKTLQNAIQAALDEEVQMRMRTGRFYLQYAGLLTVEAARDRLRDAMHEDHSPNARARADDVDLAELQAAAAAFATRNRTGGERGGRTDREAALLSHMRRLSQAGQFAELNRFLSEIPEALALLSHELGRRAREQATAPEGRKPPGILVEPPGDETLPPDVVARLSTKA